MLDYRRFKEINDLFTCGQFEKARHLLMELQSRFIALRDEILMLQTRLQNMEDALYLSKNLCGEDGFYWLNISGTRHGPFCPRCYESVGALIRLETSKYTLFCPYCHEIFKYSYKKSEEEVQNAKRARLLRFAP